MRVGGDTDRPQHAHAAPHGAPTGAHVGAGAWRRGAGGARTCQLVSLHARVSLSFFDTQKQSPCNVKILCPPVRPRASCLSSFFPGYARSGVGAWLGLGRGRRSERSFARPGGICVLCTVWATVHACVASAQSDERVRQPWAATSRARGCREFAVSVVARPGPW